MDTLVRNHRDTQRHSGITCFAEAEGGGNSWPRPPLPIINAERDSISTVHDPIPTLPAKQL